MLSFIDKDGSIDLIVDSTNPIEKAGTCSVKDPSFTVKLSGSAKDHYKRLKTVTGTSFTQKKLKKGT